MPTVTIEFRPINSTQAGFVDSQANRLLFSGAFGAGKSIALCTKALRLSQDYPKNYGLLCRKVRATLKETTLKTFFDMVCPPPLIADYNKSEGLVTLRNSSQILFGGLDDPLKLGSLNLGWVGIDEAIETNEDDWKMLEGRLRLPGVPHQIFGATNPGPPSHYLYRMFFEQKRGEVYQASALENPELPQDYRDRLAEFEGTYYQRYVLGQWVGMEGLVYSAFDERVCLIPRFEIPKRWLVHTGHDFGLANPAALFYAQDPDTGNFYLFAEYFPGSGYGIYDHVQEFKRITEGYNVINRVGGSHQEDEIRQGYTAQGWPISEPKYSKDRKYQIQKVQAMHRLNKIFVFNDLKEYLREKLSFSYPKLAEGQFGDEPEDEKRFHLMACLVGGTSIITDKGLRPIENVKVGDKVLTRQGYHRVLEAGVTGYKETITASFSNGTKLTGTPDHPIFTHNRGWISLTCLRYNDTIETWKGNQLNLTGIPTQDTQILSANRIGYILGLVSGGIYTERFGNRLTELYQKVAMFITKMATGLITILPTLSLFQLPHMNHYITQGNVLLLSGNTLQRYEDWEQHGRKQQKDEQGSVSFARNKLCIASQKLEYANSAKGNLNLISATTINSVLVPVKQHIDMPRARIMKPGYAQFVAKTSRLTSTGKSKIVLGNVPHLVGVIELKRFVKSVASHLLPKRRPITRPVQEDAVVFSHIEPRSKAPVYNLTVDAVPEYYANGILVHNCERYILSDFTPETVAEPERSRAYQF